MTFSVKSRKLNKFILVAIAFLCVVCAVAFGLKPTTAKADGVTYDQSKVDALKTDLTEKIDEFENLYHLNREKDGQKVLDILEADYLEAYAAVTDGDYTSVAETFLIGNNGFAGALGVYTRVDDYVKSISDEEILGFDLYHSHAESVRAERNRFLYSTSLFDAYSHRTTEGAYGFGYGLVNAAVAESKKTVAQYKNLTAAYDIEILNPLINELKKYEVTYFSDKFDESDVVNALFGDDGADDAEQLAEKIAGIYADVKASGRALDSSDKNALKEKMRSVAREYVAKYESVESYVVREKGKADEFISGGKTVDELKTELLAIEDAVKNYYELGEVEYPLLETKDVAAGTATVDLKAGADAEAIRSLLDTHKIIANDAITAVYETHKGEYGLSGQVPVAENRRLARELIDKLAVTDVSETEKGITLGEASYVYGEKTVADVISIIDAFEDSYVIEGALVSGDKTSANISEYNFVSSVSSKDEDGKADYVITIKCVSKADNSVELKKFDAKSYIGVRKGATASVERNINKALRNPDKYAGGVLTDDQKQDIKDHSLWYYFTLTIYEPDVNGNPVVKTDLKTDETTEYVVTIEYKADALKGKADDEDKRKGVRIIFYEHTTVTDVISNIEWTGENTMQFKVDDVSKMLTFEAITNGKVPDWACWIVIGVVAALLLFLIVLIIVKCCKNKKFKIVFNAMGGKYNTVIRVKRGAAFTYPKDPVKKGSVFMGWYTDKKGKNRFADTKLLKRKNMNVYAKWMKAEDYEKLNEQYSRAKAIVDPAVASADAQYFASLQKDPQIEKIEAEKLSYIAKKAEEDRKTEEIKLQSVKEIEMAKGNEEARLKAEQDAADARKALDDAIAERNALLERARTEERTKCNVETAASMRSENQTLAQILAGGGRTTVVTDTRNFDEELRKAKEEAKAEAKREYEEEAKRKAEEEARINALVEARIKEYEDKRRSEDEISKVDADTEYKTQLAEAREEARKAREEAEIAKEEAQKARSQALTFEEAARIAREAAEAREQERKDAEAAFVAAQAEAKPEENAETAKYFDRLKAETASYVKGDDLTFGTEKDVTVCSLTEKDGEVDLELNVPLTDLEEKGYNVVKGEKLPAAYVVKTEDDIGEALELIEEAMSANGMMKSVPQVIYASTAEERKTGYDYVIENDKVADDVNEYYSLLRAYTGSFADVEGYDGEDKPLVKMFKDGDDVLVYLNYQADGLDAAEPYMAQQGYASVVKVAGIEDCKKAMAYIEQMMKENGLIRYPLMTGYVESGDDDGFAYVLKA